MSGKFDPFRDWPKRGDHSKEPSALAAGIMTDVAQILDVVQREWSAEGSWSDHDQAVRNRITAWLSAHYASGGHVAYPRATAK